MIHFKKDNWFFELKIPEYETAIFGGQMGELRIIPESQYVLKEGDIWVQLDHIFDCLAHSQILACTFRGKEDIKIVRYLNELGFRFVGTFNTLSCNKNEFKPIKASGDLMVAIAHEEDRLDILNIEKNVYDYSTYQMDPDFDDEITAHRNLLRVKSYFNNPNHCTYVIKHSGRVIGFFQFLIDTVHKTAKAVNAAVDPGYQNMFIGPKLYSDAFKDIFSWGINTITSGCSNQNNVVLKMHRACGFRITDHEIHLRLKL